MNKTLKIYIIFLIILILGVAYIDSQRPRPIDWRPTYSINDKIPLGLYVFNEESQKMFGKDKVEKINQTPYEFFTSNFDFNDTIRPHYYKSGTFLYIDQFSRLDKESINELLTYVSYGNHAFISTKNFPSELLDTLNLNLTTQFDSGQKIHQGLINPHFNKKEYHLDEGITYSYFNKIDTLNTTVLGYNRIDTAKINFIKVKFSNGEIYLHNQPAAFTNFHLLKLDHFEYAQNILSYIPKGNIYWYTKDQINSNISSNPLRYIASQPALKWAWRLFLIGLIVFIIFNVKRRQRVVPIIKPLTNKSVEFIKTIGNLYLQEGDHDTIIDKKIIFFLNKIRSEYYMDTSILDENFSKKLQQKSGKNFEDIVNVINLINKHRRNPNESTETDLIKISNAIEKIIL